MTLENRYLIQKKDMVALEKFKKILVGVHSDLQPAIDPVDPNQHADVSPVTTCQLVARVKPRFSHVT
jgi:hypothetical protein